MSTAGEIKIFCCFVLFVYLDFLRVERREIPILLLLRVRSTNAQIRRNDEILEVGFVASRVSNKDTVLKKK